MYSPAGMAGPLLYAASSTMLGLAWKAVTFIPSRSLSSTSSSSLRHSSKSPDQSQKSLQPAIDTPSRRSPSHMELRLSTTCACGLKVSLEVPKWISDSVDIAQNSSCDGSCSRGGHGNQANQAGEVRNLVVEGVVGFAQAVKSSPLLPVIFAAVKTFVAFVVYLDARFLLREHAAHAITELATGLVEIEKELGLMRNAGEGLSIGWEALVKGVIALARSDPPSTVRATQPEFSSTSFSTNKVQPYSRFDSFDQPGYRDEPVSPTYSSSPRYPSYLTTDADESGPSTLTPSSPIGTHLSAPTYAPPLRRTPLSSPVLRTSYLSSGTSTPSQYFYEARPAPSGSSPNSYRPPSYSHEYSSPFESDPSSHLHRRSRSGPDVPSSQQSPQEGTGSSWPTRTMLGWADRLMTKADTLQQYHR